MQSIPHRFLPSVHIPHSLKEQFLTTGPHKFLEVHRVHIYSDFLTRNYYIFDILINADKRTCLYIIEAAILDEVFNGRTGLRVHLDFIKYYQSLTLKKPNPCKKAQLHEEGIKVRKI